ncbi:OmpA family protein [Paracoccus albus]|uniref:OmpA family protein n=1 Tax=Paracoccus albus TaxID=3017784 RepID=UPI0022F08025|nr:OmpA family protein [Paracoccus albus]WBU58978.1 OmpA family protein [Paracoccus albus]
MSRFIYTGSALVAVMALGVLAPAKAEIRIPPKKAQELAPQRAGQMPHLATALKDELAAGLKEGALRCLDGSQRPCADDMPLMTPTGVSVQLVANGGMILAPVGLQPYAMTPEGMPSTRGGDLAQLANQNLDEYAAAAAAFDRAAPAKQAVATGLEKAAGNREAELAAELARKQKAEAQAKAAAERKAAAEKQAKQDAQRKAQAEKKAAADAKGAADRKATENRKAEADKKAAAERQAEAQRKAAAAEAERKAEAARQEREGKVASGLAARNVEDEQRREAERRQAAERKRQEELARQLAAAQAAATAEQEAAAERAAAERAEAERARADRYAAQERRITNADARKFEAERIAAMGALNQVLQREITAGLTADGLECINGSARPCADGMALVSPGGVTAEVTQNGRIIIGPMSQQQYIVNEDGTLRARGSNTAAAREAAEAAAPTAEAFNEGARGEVVRETVASSEARSSAEDFEMSLTEALTRATQLSNNDDDDDDSGSDLAKIALAGLGALAVGQVLSGERQVALNTGDRVVVTRADGSQQVLKDDNALLRQAGNDVQTENYSDGSSRTVVTRRDGSQVITIRGSDLSVLRRIHVAPNGRETILIDDSVEVPPVEVAELPAAAEPEATPTNEEELRQALAQEAAVSRRFTLSQIRTIPEVRNIVAPVDINAITFDTGSAAINPDQARQLASLGTVIEDSIRDNPQEIFLIEGHTDAVGAATYNLALSDRRAESVALALSEYFDVPPENLVVQGYGEEYLKIPTLLSERENRRASVRRITDLLASAQ